MLRFLRKVFGGMPIDSPEPIVARPKSMLSDDESIGIMHSVGNHALADEMQRGLDRQKEREGPLHAHELTPNDAAFLRMFSGAGCTFGGDVVLPSGRRVAGEEMHRWSGPPATKAPDA